MFISKQDTKKKLDRQMKLQATSWTGVQHWDSPELRSTFSASQNLAHFRAVMIENHERWESNRVEQTYWHKEGTSIWLCGTTILTAKAVPPYLRGKLLVHECWVQTL